MAKEGEEVVKLARKPVEVSNLKPLSDAVVLAEVEELLGYKVGSQAADLKRVAEILKSLDIEPFDTKKVLAYKKQEAQKLNKRRFNYATYVASRTRGVWVSTPLFKYTKEIPAFALLRATAVARELKAANISGAFHVEELTKKHSTKQHPVPDPFMVLHVAGKNFYLDVWDEPKFEGRRTK